jgi:hypothetical protein
VAATTIGDRAVFYSSMELAVAFFDCHLRHQPKALDKLLGKDARQNNPRLEKLIIVPGKRDKDSRRRNVNKRP